jgi:hypothetical protein
LLTVAPFVSLADALDAPNRPWTTNGTPRWFGQTNVTHDGFEAAQSGAIDDDTSTSIQTTVTGPGVLKFWWKVSCETNNDRLLFYVNGSEKARISGEVDWEPHTFNLGTNSQVLQWKYSKDDETSQGQDHGWVDQVEFIPSSSGTSIGVSINVFGDGVRLTWIAGGGRTYQVLCSDNLTNAVWTELNNTQVIFPPIGSVEDTMSNSLRFYRVLER